MSRRREVPKREIIPDSKYGDVQVAKFIRVLMKQGKKSTAEKIIYDAFDIIEKKHEEEPLKVFKEALEQVKPKVEVKSRRVGGATYQVPMEVRAERRNSLAMRWLSDYARKRGEKSMIEKLAAELHDASQGRGSSIKKREDTHKMAEANKAFAHFRW